MASSRDTRVLFVPYRPGRAGQKVPDDGEISQQKHAAREYHRKAKEIRHTLKQQQHSKHSEKGNNAPQTPATGNSGISLPLSPRSILGAGRIDPLNSLPINDTSPHAKEMFDFCTYMHVSRT
jgi:hypothetical protein